MKTRVRIETVGQVRKFIDRLYALTNQHASSEVKRGQWRMTYVADGQVNVACEDNESEEEPIYITTKDISVNGLGFMTKKKFQRGQKLIIRIEVDEGEEIELEGVVVHCTASVGMYKVGVKLSLVAVENN